MFTLFSTADQMAKDGVSRQCVHVRTWAGRLPKPLLSQRNRYWLKNHGTPFSELAGRVERHEPAAIAEAAQLLRDMSAHEVKP